MTDEMQALARRAVACKAWRWMPGMRDTTGIRVSRGVAETPEDAFYPGGIRDGDGRARPEQCVVAHDALPDFNDPATVGCLLALVREALGRRVWVKWWCPTAPDMSGIDRSWCEVVDRAGRRVVAGPRVQHPTEAHALVAALAVAP